MIYNEMSKDERYKLENIDLVGVSLNGHVKTLLKIFMNDLKKYEGGKHIKLNGEDIRIKIKLFNFMSDTPARCESCGTVSHNSKEGCLWCKIIAQTDERYVILTC
jgi:hypothetical protein